MSFFVIMFKVKIVQKIIDEKQTTKTVKKRKLNDKKNFVFVTNQVNFQLLNQWINVQVDKLYKWIKSIDEMIIIKIDDFNYEWLIFESEIFNNIAKVDKFALNWTKIKKINFDDTITWLARNITFINYDMNWMIDFDIKIRNKQTFWSTMFNDNELMIMSREFFDFAYILHDQIQIFRERMFLQNEFRSEKTFISSNIRKK